MVRDFCCILFALLVLAWMLLPASAAEQTGEIRVSPMWGDLPVSGGKAALYHVGKPVSGGFQLTGSLSNNTLTDVDAFSGKFLQWILRCLPKNCVESVVTREGAVFTGLEEGLYVVKQTEPAAGYMAFRPFLVSVPMGEQWTITASPKVITDGQTPETGDDVSVVFGFAGMLLSALGLAAMERKRRRQRGKYGM